jgi:glycosyltransferase involved in cell wall biosynthesis
MNILLISVRADHGGGPEHMARLIESAPLDVKFTVACPNEQPYWTRYGELIGSGSLIAIPHRKFSASSLARMATEVRARRIEVIHSHGKGAGLYGRALRLLTRRPVVHTFHGLHTGAYNRLARAAYLALERALVPLTCCAIAVSEGEAEQLRRAGIGRRLRVIRNGVRLPGTTHALALKPPFRVVMMTRYDHQKRAELIVDIAETLRSRGELERFRFELLGTGPGAAALARTVDLQCLDRAVRMHGAVDEPARYLNGALAYLSTSRWEGLPLAVLEAMAHGVPVVATDVVGNRDAVVDGTSGFLYDAGNPAAAADALIALARRPELQKRAAESARATAAEWYSADRMSREIVACYRALLNQNGGRPGVIDCRCA